MDQAGRKGWVVFSTEAGFGHSPEIERVIDEGFKIIVRLNYGYSGKGTIPPHSANEKEYDDFAAQCGNYVHLNPKGHIWVIGNEMNHSQERPGFESDVKKGTPITPNLYARCFEKCRAAIHGQPGHEGDLVLVGAVAPWNNETRYGNNTDGNWIQYFKDTLDAIKSHGGADGITLHTYTHDVSPDLIESEARHTGGFPALRWEFRTYIDFMEAIPSDMRHLPVYITETDQDKAWDNKPNRVWIQRAYDEIARWNSQPGNQQIRALVLYRWIGDQWEFGNKGDVLEDLKAAMRSRPEGHRWDPNAAPAIAPPPPLPQIAPTFQEGQQAIVVAAANLRKTAGFVGAPKTDVLGEVAKDTPATILAPSKKADGLTWWHVRTTLKNGADAEGWIAQASSGGATLLSAKA